MRCVNSFDNDRSNVNSVQVSAICTSDMDTEPVIEAPRKLLGEVVGNGIGIVHLDHLDRGAHVGGKRVNVRALSPAIMCPSPPLI